MLSWEVRLAESVAPGLPPAVGGQSAADILADDETMAWTQRVVHHALAIAHGDRPMDPPRPGALPFSEGPRSLRADPCDCALAVPVGGVDAARRPLEALEYVYFQTRGEDHAGRVLDGPLAEVVSIAEDAASATGVDRAFFLSLVCGVTPSQALVDHGIVRAEHARGGGDDARLVELAACGLRVREWVRLRKGVCAHYVMQGGAAPAPVPLPRGRERPLKRPRRRGGGAERGDSETDGVRRRLRGAVL